MSTQFFILLFLFYLILFFIIYLFIYFNKKIMMKNEWNGKKINWNLGQNNITWKFEDLIKLWIILINQIKSLIEELISLGT